MPVLQPVVSDTPLSGTDLAHVWRLLAPQERVEGFLLLPRAEAEELFFALSSADQAAIVLGLPEGERRSWIRLLAPDDAADLIQAAPGMAHQAFLSLLDEPTRKEVLGLLAYAEDQAGGLMNTRFARLRPDMSVDEAMAYLRRQGRKQVETIYYTYVLAPDQRLLGVVSFRELFDANTEHHVRDIMRTNVVTITSDTAQADVSRLFQRSRLIALPVVDREGRMQGIVTMDDIVHVVTEQATDEIQRIGGSEALGSPYLDVGFGSMVQKRAGWLSALFLGEMLTATAMGYFEKEIERAVVLALFVPLIISSGGNSGSQASTLVIRAMALGEVRLGDWWRVVRRELGAGMVLGTILGSIGFARILAWVGLFGSYGEHYLLVGLTVALSLIGVVTFGTLAGSLLPFILRRLGFDPASACAPFVATLVDVTGLIIYFTVASVLFRGTLL
ncbi:MAG TPA: magnesium transporter [Candidatus Binatia bacterium]|jgi:magnesium transporter|nr:magnesium transporter [Candidatus Binatia bacterium]